MLWPYQSADPYLGQDPNPIMEQRQWLDVPYATKSAAQTLDLHLPPDADGPFPLIVGIHGGAFRMGTSRNREMDPIIGATGRGYAVASINYRLSSEAISVSYTHLTLPTTAWSTWTNFDCIPRSTSEVARQLSGGGGGIRTLDTLAGIAV